MKYHLDLSWCHSWKLYFKQIGESVQKQLIKWIANEYEQGNYPYGFQMPSVRQLSEVLKVKRHQIEAAYRYWIKRKEILYTLNRVGTYMYHPSAPADVCVASSALFPFRELDAVTLPVRGQGAMNLMTLGSSYPFSGNEVLNLSTGKRPSVRFPFKEKTPCLFSDALTLLRKRKLINNDRQFCIIPYGEAISKVLKMTTNMGDLLVISSPEDVDLIEKARQLRLNVEFSGSDGQGMSAIRLEEICERSIVKVIFVRPEPDFPVPVRMAETRWTQILELAARYGFCIVVLDDDYEFRSKKLPRLDFSLGHGNLIYLSPYSKLYPMLHETCMVAGPENFIAGLREITKRIYIGWEKSAEKALMASFSRSELKMQLRKSRDYCIKSAFNLQLLYKNYLPEFATLTLPEGGSYAFLKFKRPLTGALAVKLCEHPLFYEEENFNFESDQPIHAFRISLFVKDWGAIEFSMKMIRSIMDESPRTE
ncbi:hypothetical protein [Pedobacter gandavensis]|uniref:hypothetical protein n=1 Tax=Pedobacter gandavensis TaxID=2679963 RepID=UPI0029310652|nr:hypothetical protein [Pedobacter gandavensis]